MHEPVFAVAARPARFSILGLPMKPYSIGHEMLLLGQNNALLYEGFDSIPLNEQRAAIIRAVLICSQGWLANQKPHRWLRLWQWLNRNPDYPLAIADFRNYRAQGSAFPPAPSIEAQNITRQMRGEKNREGRELGSPYMARLYNFVASLPYGEIRIHGETIYDFPMSLANFLYISHLECVGDAKIENTEEAEIRLKLEKARSRMAKEKESETCQH